MAESSPPESSAASRRCGATRAATVASTTAIRPAWLSSHPRPDRQKFAGRQTAVVSALSPMTLTAPGLTAVRPRRARRSPSSSGALAISPSTGQSMARSAGSRASTRRGGSRAAITAPP